MIAHHQRLALFRVATAATTTSVRERSSWTAVLAAQRRSAVAVGSVSPKRQRHCCNVRSEQPQNGHTNPIMGNIGSMKRTLVTATAAAAMACTISRHAGRVLATGNSPNGKPSDHHRRRHAVEGKTATTKQNVILQRQLSTNANPHKQGPVPTLQKRTETPTPLPTVLRTLVRRLNEPVPLRATTPATTAASLDETTTTITTTTTEPPTVVEEQRRMAELADELVARYDSLPPLRSFGMQTGNEDNKDSYDCERSEILAFLAKDCCSNQETVQTAVRDYASSSRSNHHLSNNHYEKLQRATTPIYEGLMDFVLQQNAVTGMGFLISLREDLLSSMKYQHHHQDHNSKARQQQQPFRDLDAHLKKTFQRWFAPGLLKHERITYDLTPAKIIEAIATKEAVHPMKSLDDLKERLGATKRVFALFHPCLPNQPLVFVHVALLPSSLPPSSMEEIMATASSEKTGQKEPTDSPEVAAFYSISNGVKGLAGVGLGEYLLKESIGALKEELPSLQTFVTLSPIPRFRKWIKVAFLKEEQRQQQQQQTNESNAEESSTSSSFLLSKNDREALHRCGLVSSAWPFPWEEFLGTLEEIDFPKLIQDAKTTTDKDIYNFLLNEQDRETSTAEPEQKQQLQQATTRQQFFVLRSVLLKLASSYLFVEKHRGKPLDKVCGFHVGNGAELHDLHFGADLSRGGLSNSYGLMANYLYPYDTAKVSRNQANFESSGFVVPVGPGVRKWLDATEDEIE